MKFNVLTQDGFEWTITTDNAERLGQLLTESGKRYINFGKGIMEQRGNLAAVLPVLPEDATENLFDIYLNNGTVVQVQEPEEDGLLKVTQHLNASRGDFVPFGGGWIGAHSPRRITEHGAIKQD